MQVHRLAVEGLVDADRGSCGDLQATQAGVLLGPILTPSLVIVLYLADNVVLCDIVSDRCRLFKCCIWQRGRLRCYENDLFLGLKVEFASVISLSSLGGENFAFTLDSSVLLMKRIRKGLYAPLSHLGSKFERAFAAVFDHERINLMQLLDDAVVSFLSESKLSKIVCVH